MRSMCDCVSVFVYEVVWHQIKLSDSSTSTFSHVSLKKHTDHCVENHSDDNQSQESSQHRLDLSSYLLSFISSLFLCRYYYRGMLCFQPCWGDSPAKVKEVIAGSWARKLMAGFQGWSPASYFISISFSFLCLCVPEEEPPHRWSRKPTSFKGISPRMFSTKQIEVKHITSTDASPSLCSCYAHAYGNFNIKTCS